MSDWTKQLAAAREQIQVDWTEARAGALIGGVQKQRARRRRQRRVLAAGGAAVAVLAIALTALRMLGTTPAPGPIVTRELPRPGLPAPAAPAAPEPASTRLTDGSLLRPLGTHSRLAVREERAERTVIALQQGSARFEVQKNPARVFRVESGPVAVEVLGTRFVVDRLPPAAGGEPRSRVTVEEGRVRVLWAAQYAELRAGETRVFPPEPLGPEESRVPEAPVPTAQADDASADAAKLARARRLTAATPAAEPKKAAAVALVPRAPAPRRRSDAPETAARVPAPAPPRAGADRPAADRAPDATRPPAPVPVHVAAAERAPDAPADPARPTPTWKVQAREGQFDSAYVQAFSATPGARALEAAAGAPADLLLLADVARLSHHPGDAVAPLDRLLRDHARDPRAPLAAFTLGRVQLDDLGRPREAAGSFRRAQQLDPEGPLAQDALAREVEAWSRAGEAQSARERARLYLERYPGGRRVRSVKRYGELE